MSKLTAGNYRRAEEALTSIMRSVWTVDWRYLNLQLEAEYPDLDMTEVFAVHEACAVLSDTLESIREDRPEIDEDDRWENRD